MNLQWLQHQAQVDGVDATVVGLIVRQGPKILLLKRRPDDFMPNVWEIPGGHVDPGETLGDTMARELYEETGLTLTRIVAYAGGYDYPGEFGITRQWNFDVQTTKGPIVHPEHVAYRWATPAQWSHLAMTSEMRESLNAYVGRIGCPDI